MSENTENKIVFVDWSITGYHKFKLKPSKVNEGVIFERERDNQHDPWAILVKLQDGRPIGRVPANLCKTLIKLKESRLITGLKCFYTGTCTHSKAPHFTTSYKRSKTYDRNGGGVILTARYRLVCPLDKYEEFKTCVQNNIPRLSYTDFR